MLFWHGQQLVCAAAVASAYEGISTRDCRCYEVLTKVKSFLQPLYMPSVKSRLPPSLFKVSAKNAVPVLML